MKAVERSLEGRWILYLKTTELVAQLEEGKRLLSCKSCGKGMETGRRHPPVKPFR